MLCPVDGVLNRLAKRKGYISTLNGGSLKLAVKFTYLGSSFSSAKNEINRRLAMALITIDRLSIIWKSDLSDEIKHNSFQAAIVSFLLNECITWTLTKRIEKT